MKKNTGSEYNHNYNKGQIIDFGMREKGFHVSPQYRQDKVREKARRLVARGLMSRSRTVSRYSDGLTFYTTKAGREWFDKYCRVVFKLYVSGKPCFEADTWLEVATQVQEHGLGLLNEDNKLEWSTDLSVNIYRQIVGKED